MPGLVSHEDLQLVAPFSCIPEVIRHFGVDPAEVLTAAGLSANALDDPEATIPYAAVGLVLEAAADKTRCPHFGLELGKRFRTNLLGLVGQFMQNAPTLGEAVRYFVFNQHRNAHGSVAYLLEDRREAIWGYAIYHPHIRGHSFICDHAAMAGFNVVCELVGAEHKHAVRVLLSRTEPQDSSAYHYAFGVKLRFNAEQTALILPRALLDLPVIGADASLQKVLEKRVAALWHAGELDAVTWLRRTLRVALLSGPVSGDEVAAQMRMSRRTLHRRLRDWRLRFQDVLDETRCELAQQLLANTRLSISQIAGIVGYADPAVLTRSFERWTGTPPSEWRSISVCLDQGRN